MILYIKGIPDAHDFSTITRMDTDFFDYTIWRMNSKKIFFTYTI